MTGYGVNNARCLKKMGCFVAVEGASEAAQAATDTVIWIQIWA